MSAPSGNVIVIAEADYRYGVGKLRLRLDRVDRLHPVPFDGEDWLQVEGVQLTADGTELRPRRVLVRARSLPRS